MDGQVNGGMKCYTRTGPPSAPCLPPSHSRATRWSRPHIPAACPHGSKGRRGGARPVIVKSRLAPTGGFPGIGLGKGSGDVKRVSAGCWSGTMLGGHHCSIWARMRSTLGLRCPSCSSSDAIRSRSSATCSCTSASSPRTQPRSAGTHPDSPSRAITASPQGDCRTSSPTSNRSADEEEIGGSANEEKIDGGFTYGLLIRWCIGRYSDDCNRISSEERCKCQFVYDNIHFCQGKWLERRGKINPALEGHYGRGFLGVCHSRLPPFSA